MCSIKAGSTKNAKLKKEKKERWKRGREFYPR